MREGTPFVVPLLAALISWALAPPTAVAQEAAEVQDVLGWHTVQPGENFQSITKRYLGTANLWQENWKLNPQVSDPGRLRVGQRLRVIVERQLPARQAIIEEIANDVDKNLQRSGWEDAVNGDALAPSDGVRTREEASTRLGFDDGSQLTLTELSQVFLKDLDTSVTGVRRGSIVIEEGQAELVLKAPRPDKVAIEIVVGDSVARPRPGPAGTAQTRSRKPAGGGAQLMVYGGSSQIEAGGAAVEVPRGMGTSVPEGGAPEPPEKLLPAPKTSAPAGGTEFGYANPRLAWQAVRGAAAYVVEVCLDSACSQLVARAAALTEPSWHPERLPLGDLFWRVSAVSASGLDGYPSRSVPFAVLSEQRDEEPPVAVVARVGNGFAAPDGTLVLGPGATIRLASHDDASGVATLRYRWQAGAWQSWQGDDLSPPEDIAPATDLLATDLPATSLDLQATDHLGRTSRIWSVPVRRDQTPPEAPRVERQH